MKILYCNIAVAGRSGTEIVTIETARILNRLGHDVCIYTSVIGRSSSHLKQIGVSVLTDLDRLPWQPDVIHSNHLPQSIETAVRFPSTPQIFICHDAQEWHSHAPALSVIRRWIAVDEICAARIERAIHPSSPVIRLTNAVDTDVYRRRPPLPKEARSALALVKNSSHIDAIKAACQQAGLHLDIVGPAVGNTIQDLPKALPAYDLVFATARMALEAMAVGCSVIIVDGRGLAGIVTSESMSEWRRHNFGSALLTKAVTKENLYAEIERYDSIDAGLVSDFIRRDASLSDYADRLVEVYKAAIADFMAVPTNPSQTLRDVFETTLRFMNSTLIDALPPTSSKSRLLSLYQFHQYVARLKSSNFLLRQAIRVAVCRWKLRLQSVKERFWHGR